MIVDVLIVSSIYDFSTDLVVQELENRGVNYFRLNKENFGTYRSTIDIENRLLEVIANGESYKVTSATKSIYYRQPVFLRNTPSNVHASDRQATREGQGQLIHRLTWQACDTGKPRGAL